MYDENGQNNHGTPIVRRCGDQNLYKETGHYLIKKRNFWKSNLNDTTQESFGIFFYFYDLSYTFYLYIPSSI